MNEIENAIEKLNTERDDELDHIKAAYGKYQINSLSAK